MSDYFDRVERQIVQRVQAGSPRSGRLPFAAGYLAMAASVLVVIVVAGVFLLARGGGGNPSPVAPGGSNVVFTAPSGVSAALVEQSAGILRRRLHVAVPAARVSVADGAVVVTAPARARSEILALGAPGVLTFYDWEGQALAPNGKTVASQLPSPNPMILAISQGYGSSAPGQLESGCVTLQQALALAAKDGAGRPRRTEYIGRQRLRVPFGFTVLQAASLSPGGAGDGYFLVRGNPVLSGRELVNPHASASRNIRAPDVEFGFSAAGRRRFQAMTRAVALRGAEVSSPGRTLNQHFAIVLDNKLLSVPFIDYRQYPDGINGDDGADVAAGFTPQAAKNLAILLRYGPLPVNLTATG